ncbi:MAG: leucine-rich repeat domain-containing protein [Oscillospiraceae bacterium]|nr:leucine-rich repeat domain-containing protein [Oscillospiraceae bacterium]
MAKKNNKNTYSTPRPKRKKLAVRILILILAVATLMGIVIMPLASKVSAETDPADLVVKSFETGKLAEAISEAADGTDYNFIKNVAVLSGTLNAQDYSALTAIPNLEILELAGTETEGGVIPENALTSRNQLSFISLPKNTVEIGSNAFSSNRKLTKITIPSTVTRIGDYAFAYCETLESFPVSEAVQYIGEGAFQDCKAITEFVIPAGITEIYPNTFSKCGFEKISIGPDVTRIGESVFADCNALKDIYAYGKDAPALGGDVFRNVSASIHCYEDSEESYQSWLQQNMTLSADLTGEYTLTAEAPAESNDAYPETEAAAAEDAADAITENTPANTEAEAASAAPAAGTVSAEVQQSSGGLSIGVVIVIVVMAMIIAVLATVLVMVSRKKK